MKTKRLKSTTGPMERFGPFDLAVHLILILLTVAFLYPLLHVLAVSFSDPFSISANQVLVLPKGFNLESYAYILRSNKVFRAFGNSIYYTVVGTTLNLLLTALMAYPLSKNRLTGRSVVLKLVMFTMFFSGGTIPTFLLVKDLGLLDTPWSLWLPNAIWSMEMLILISFFRSLPESLFESAYIDGASEYCVFWKIAMPLSKASLASIGMFYFMGHWNSYFQPMMYLNTVSKFPLQLVLRSMLLEDSEQLMVQAEVVQAAVTPAGVKNAVIFITMIPVMLVYPFVQRYFVKGIMIGSIKG